jgi:tRNA (mo5U34)-methyltransferase
LSETLIRDESARESVQGAIDRLGPWFHNLHLPGGMETMPNHPYYGDFPRRKWERIAPHIPEELSGWRALDIGCNAGFYTFELARRGAHVTAIDVDAHYLDQARWAAGQMGLTDQITFRQMQVYDLAREADAYDLVWFMGVFYHLRYPMLGLDIVTEKVKRLLVFQTLTMPGMDETDTPENLEMTERERMREPGWPAMSFIEHRLAGDPTNWWAPSHAGIEAMLRAAGMRVVGRPGEETYVAEPDPERPSAMRTWNRGEYLAATGQSQPVAPQSNSNSGNGHTP